MTEEKTTSLKLLPSGAKKSQIFKMYPRIPERNMRDLIHYWEIQFNPHLPEEKVKGRQWVSRNVMEKIIETEGPPSGYQNKFK